MELRCGAYVLYKSLKISVSDFELLILARPSKLGNGWEGFSLSLLYFSLFSYFQSFEDNKIGQEKSNSSNLDESTPSYFEKQPFRGVLRKKCSEIMQQIYRRTPMPNCDFNKVTLRHGCSPVHLLHIFRTPLPKSTSGRLLLYLEPPRFKDQFFLFLYLRPHF